MGSRVQALSLWDSAVGIGVRISWFWNSPGVVADYADRSSSIRQRRTPSLPPEAFTRPGNLQVGCTKWVFVHKAYVARICICKVSIGEATYVAQTLVFRELGNEDPETGIFLKPSDWATKSPHLNMRCTRLRFWRALGCYLQQPERPDLGNAKFPPRVGLSMRASKH